jgi:uncharacterized membrane protein YqiK
MTTHSDASGGSDEKPQETPRYDDINVPVVVMWGFISALVTLITILFVSGVYNVWSDSWIAAREGQFVNQPAREQVEQQKAILSGGQGVIPIAEAKQKVLEKFKK